MSCCTASRVKAGPQAPEAVSYNRRINFIEVKTCTDMHKSKHACMQRKAGLPVCRVPTVWRTAVTCCKLI